MAKMIFHPAGEAPTKIGTQLMQIDPIVGEITGDVPPPAEPKFDIRQHVSSLNILREEFLEHQDKANAALSDQAIKHEDFGKQVDSAFVAHQKQLNEIGENLLVHKNVDDQLGGQIKQLSDFLNLLSKSSSDFEQYVNSKFSENADAHVKLFRAQVRQDEKASEAQSNIKALESELINRGRELGALRVRVISAETQIDDLLERHQASEKLVMTLFILFGVFAVAATLGFWFIR